MMMAGTANKVKKRGKSLRACGFFVSKFFLSVLNYKSSRMYWLLKSAYKRSASRIAVLLLIPFASASCTSCLSSCCGSLNAHSARFSCFMSYPTLPITNPPFVLRTCLALASGLPAHRCVRILLYRHWCACRIRLPLI